MITHRFDCPEHGMFTILAPDELRCPIRGICQGCRRKQIVASRIDQIPERIKDDFLECNGHCEIIEHRINSRFHFKDGHLVKTTNGQPIPHDEPVVILRGRDHLVVATLEYYSQLAIRDGCNEQFIEELEQDIARFRQWAIQNYDKMKQPNVTKGR